MTRRFWTHEEDKTLKELAGVVPASAMAEALGRPIGGVHGRLKRLGLSSRLKGEHHWNAKLDGLQAAMLITLFEAGFKVQEVKQALNLPISINALHDMAAGRTWRE